MENKGKIKLNGKKVRSNDEKEEKNWYEGGADVADDKKRK